MFDWLGDILSGLGDALRVVFEGIGADIAVDIWNALVEWSYNTVFDAVADLFTSMNNMGAEIFNLSWVNAVVRLFTLFGWALFAVGVVGAVFEVAIEAQSGRTSIKGATLNVLKGFFACALIGVVPVELYGTCRLHRHLRTGTSHSRQAGTPTGCARPDYALKSAADSVSRR